jgi:nucleoside-diphosphate kinase
MVKPRATEKHLGPILESIVHHGMTIRRMETRQLTRADAEFLYAEHAGKPFYDALIEYTASGPVALLHLTKLGASNAVGYWRMVMGNASNPSAATLRGAYANPGVKRENALHGADSADAARRELAYFFFGGKRPDELNDEDFF